MIIIRRTHVAKTPGRNVISVEARIHEVLSYLRGKYKEDTKREVTREDEGARG